MELDVVEIAPSASSRSPKLLKRKEIILREVIDVVEDKDSADIMIIDKKLDSRNKGKTIKSTSNGYSNHQAKGTYSNSSSGPGGVDTLETLDSVQYSNSFAPESHSSINLECHSSDNYHDADRYIDFYTNDAIDVDKYDILQAQFDKVDIPPGVEASLPWFPDLSQIKSTAPVGSGSNYGSPMKSEHAFPFHGVDPFPSLGSSKAAQFSMKSTSANALINPHGVELSAPQFIPVPLPVHRKSKTAASKPSGSALKNRHGEKSFHSLLFLKSALDMNNSNSSLNQPHSMKLPHVSEPPSKVHNFPYHVKEKGDSSMVYSNIPYRMDMLKHPSGADAFSWSQASQKYKEGSFVPSFTPYYPGVYDRLDDLPIFLQDETDNYWGQELAGNQRKKSEAAGSAVPSDSNSSNGNDRNLEDILMKFRLFKQFDTVDDHSDHYYACKGSSMKQPSKVWAKRIQEEWKILEKDLPDTIFVRVYESRMDLLRAVIKGAEGTPYHDGLYFFDVFFPSGYPDEPPKVYYHSGGLRLNPNLYNYGKVCLSLLNTWPGGDQNENWIPGKSSMLQVLVSIQGLILNAKPYFNEPGYANMDGTPRGERESLKYNEDTFIYSLRTMSFTMRRPPKHFEDLVIGHFCERGHDVMVACQAYMHGTQVGCVVKGGVQDVDEGNKSCSESFKLKLAQYVPLLAKDLTNTGAKECEEFIVPPASVGL